MSTLQIKSISRESTGGLYIANELNIQNESTWMDKVCVSLRGSRDVYYLNMGNGKMYVYRAKLDKDVNGCLFVRNRDEYTAIYNAIATQRYANMPEHYYDRMDRLYNESRQNS